MEELTAVVLNKKHDNIIMRNAHIRVPWGSHMVVDKMLGRLDNLPTEIRAFPIVHSILIEHDGLLYVNMVAIPEGGWKTVLDIVADARNQAAWSCVRDGKPRWIVHPSSGHPRPLCPECQTEKNITLECHSA